jgi:3'(2'), 5'-bisphosphate nucleotidase
LLNFVIDVAKQAGETIMHYYGNSDHELKFDQSPVTIADLESSKLIIRLLERETSYPVLSEESIVDYKVRQSWGTYWLVDPLDGTKEFISQNPEFTVNIALIKNGRPIMGVVYSPVLNNCWWASKDCGAYKDGKRIFNNLNRSNMIGVDSRFHSTKQIKSFFERNNIHNIKNYGSSLKMCRIAEGSADIYPRLNGTMEWDTAASEVILYESGCEILSWPDKSLLQYNKSDLTNPYFVACKKDLEWK